MEPTSRDFVDGIREGMLLDVFIDDEWKVGCVESVTRCVIVKLRQVEDRPNERLIWDHSNLAQLGTHTDPEVPIRHSAEHEDQKMEAVIPNSKEICQYFLKGRCRFKAKCKFSHDVKICVHCNDKLPSSKVSASAHLYRCFKSRMNVEKNQLANG